MTDELKTLMDAFHEELCDAYDFEHQLVAALPTVAAAAHSNDLRDALEQHLAETRTQIGRLVEVFRLLGQPPTRKHCAGMAGILEESNDVVEADDFEPEVKDACLIAGCRRVEHYEMAVYGTLIAWAQTLELTEAESLLEQTLDEEEAADEALSDLAESEMPAEA